MFIIGHNAFSEGIFGNTIPSKTTYDKTSFYGNAVLDQLHMKNIELSDSDIVDKYNDTQADEWDNNSIFLANFEDTLEAGSIITGLTSPLDKYIIRRKETGDSLNPILTTISNANITNYKDYTCRNKTNYTYTVYPAYSDGFEGVGIEGDGIMAFDGWILSDTTATPVTSYIFNIEIKTSPFKINRGFKMNENHTKFPTFRFSDKNYRTGGISTVPLTAELLTSETLRSDLFEFLNNGEEKILRSPSGDAMRVMVINPQYKYFDEVGDQPFTVDFEVVEVSEVT